MNLIRKSQIYFSCQMINMMLEQQQPYPYYQPTQSSSYFYTLKCELDRESMMILNSYVPNENKKRSLRSLKERVDNAFYTYKITYTIMK